MPSCFSVYLDVSPSKLPIRQRHSWFFSNEVESVVELIDDATDEEIVAPTKRRDKRKPLPVDLPRIEIVHELSEHELTCARGCCCRKHAIGEEVSEQLEIVPMPVGQPLRLSSG